MKINIGYKFESNKNFWSGHKGALYCIISKLPDTTLKYAHRYFKIIYQVKKLDYWDNVEWFFTDVFDKYTDKDLEFISKYLRLLNKEIYLKLIPDILDNLKQYETNRENLCQISFIHGQYLKDHPGNTFYRQRFLLSCLSKGYVKIPGMEFLEKLKMAYDKGFSLDNILGVLRNDFNLILEDEEWVKTFFIPFARRCFFENPSHDVVKELFLDKERLLNRDIEALLNSKASELSLEDWLAFLVNQLLPHWRLEYGTEKKARKRVLSYAKGLLEETVIFNIFNDHYFSAPLEGNENNRSSNIYNLEDQ